LALAAIALASAAAIWPDQHVFVGLVSGFAWPRSVTRTTTRGD